MVTALKIRRAVTQHTTRRLDGMPAIDTPRTRSLDVGGTLQDLRGVLDDRRRADSAGDVGPRAPIGLPSTIFYSRKKAADSIRAA
jgi:hypothetical protein